MRSSPTLCEPHGPLSSLVFDSTIVLKMMKLSVFWISCHPQYYIRAGSYITDHRQIIQLTVRIALVEADVAHIFSYLFRFSRRRDRVHKLFLYHKTNNCVSSGRTNTSGGDINCLQISHLRAQFLRMLSSNMTIEIQNDNTIIAVVLLSFREG